MKTIAPARWGASHVVLKMFYTAYIRAKISFCSSTFRSACPSTFNKLSVIQNACLRLILGARRSTPILSLEAEYQLPPISLYFYYLFAKLFIKKLFSPLMDGAARVLLKDEAQSIPVTLHKFCVAIVLQ